MARVHASRAGIFPCGHLEPRVYRPLGDARELA